jgi:hypothetical protein
MTPNARGISPKKSPWKTGLGGTGSPAWSGIDIDSRKAAGSKCMRSPHSGMISIAGAEVKVLKTPVFGT